MTDKRIGSFIFCLCVVFAFVVDFADGIRYNERGRLWIYVSFLLVGILWYLFDRKQIRSHTREKKEWGREAQMGFAPPMVLQIVERGPGLPGNGEIELWRMEPRAQSRRAEDRQYGFVSYRFDEQIVVQRGVYIRWEIFRQHYFNGFVSNHDDQFFGSIGLFSILIYAPLIYWWLGLDSLGHDPLSWIALSLGLPTVLGLLTHFLLRGQRDIWGIRSRLSKLVRTDAKHIGVDMHINLGRILERREIYGTFVDGRLVTFYPLKDADDPQVVMAEIARIERVLDARPTKFGGMTFKKSAS